MYHNNTVLRRYVEADGETIFVTGTIGTSSFPVDAKNYDELLETSDKTLYRGKMKGRNCYIVYVKGKHEHLEVKKMYRESIDTIVMRLYSLFDNVFKVKDRGIEFIENYLLTALRVQRLIYVDNDGNFFDLNKNTFLFNAPNVLKLFDEDGFFTAKSSADFNDIDLELRNKFYNASIESLFAVKMSFNKNNLGCIMLAEKRFSRIWQPDEKAMLVVFARLYHDYLLKLKEKEEANK